ncbi:MAG: hypothetical protein V3573_11135 [Desulfovibrionaceae bacterium]
MLRSIICYLLLHVIVLSLPFFCHADCETDFNDGVRYLEEGLSATKREDWAGSAKYFEWAANSFDRAAWDCDADNAQNARDNAETARKNLAISQKNMGAVERNKTFDHASSLFKKGVGLSEEEKHTLAAEAFDQAAEVWENLAPRMSAEGARSARENAETARGNARISRKKADLANALVLGWSEAMYSLGEEALNKGDYASARESFADVAQSMDSFLKNTQGATRKDVQALIAKSKQGLIRCDELEAEEKKRIAAIREEREKAEEQEAAKRTSAENIGCLEAFRQARTLAKQCPAGDSCEPAAAQFDLAARICPDATAGLAREQAASLRAAQQ